MQAAAASARVPALGGRTAWARNLAAPVRAARERALLASRAHAAGVAA